MKIIFEKIHTDAKIPTKAHDSDACWDLYSVESKWIWPFTTKAISTGLRFNIPVGKLHIYSRSGLAKNNTICVYNAPGVVDEAYRGEVKIILYNGSIFPFKVRQHMKIAQFSRELVLDDQLEEGVVDTDTARGENGFGSSGM